MPDAGCPWHRPGESTYALSWGALTDVKYTITVTDTVRDTVKIYVNPTRHFGSVIDTNAFCEAPLPFPCPQPTAPLGGGAD